ncbi:C4-dicarboxylate-specific signal transduction histidine kinase [Actinoplanes lutulentus]|uniref:sensor histidine kinase n=1 Tax=Actinoplanes lutulentus TaxID=1287878 RepID=UPI000DB9FF91|nr:ATP-binding protein [Actinoplanes lutulentus]MBB2945883.1 C4-dicarboxylate-specific signal transduction histidine kinase [Actinoplanes lutulentus]
MGRLSRLIAGCAGIAVAVCGVVSARTLDDGGPPEGYSSTPAVALIPAGIALLVQAAPISGGRAGRLRAGAAVLFALIATGLAAVALVDQPAASVATLLSGLALACFDLRLPRQDGSMPFRVADPLLLGAAVIALVALVPRLFAPAFPPGRGPDSVMSLPQAGALLVLTAGAVLARSLDQADLRQRPLVEELRDREDFAQTLLQSMNEAVMVLDANYRVIDVNRRWRELTGYADDDLARDPPPLPPPGSGGDWTIPRADGTAVPVLATMAAIPDAAGTTRGYVATCVDIAERKHAEDALTEHAAELERGNAQLASALAFKNDLTSMLTHDVAQPISSIASLAELLCADWADLPDDIRLELATKIDKNTRRLVKMMNDLQLLFRLDTGSVTARRVPAPLHEVVRTVSATMAGDDVEIAIDEDLAALIDRGHLTVVVENLLKNALTHGAPPIVVQAEPQGTTVLLVVQDSGPGVPEAVLPGIFGRFSRGAGLGLFIVRHLVEANGGTVRYEHATPQGARLLVTLERAPA